MEKNIAISMFNGQNEFCAVYTFDELKAAFATKFSSIHDFIQSLNFAENSKNYFILGDHSKY